MLRTPLVSRAVIAAAYDASTQTLELEFATGRIYQFDGVPQAVYDWLLRTPSKGVYVSRLINGRYPHRDVTVVTGQERDLEAELRASLEDMARVRVSKSRDEAPRATTLEQALRASLHAAPPLADRGGDDEAQPNARRNHRDPSSR